MEALGNVADKCIWRRSKRTVAIEELRVDGNGNALRKCVDGQQRVVTGSKSDGVERWCTNDYRVAEAQCICWRVGKEKNRKGGGHRQLPATR